MNIHGVLETFEKVYSTLCVLSEYMVIGYLVYIQGNTN